MNRIKSVDVFRFFAIIGVIAIHTTPFNLSSSEENELHNLISITINQLARFAVPFFFTISGYFWGEKIRNGYEPISLSYKMAKRISTILLIWCFIYLLPYNLGAFYDYGILGPIEVAYTRVVFFIQHPLIMIMQGTRPHLWFLVALLFSLWISAVFINRKWIKSLFFLSFFLYIFGILSKAYADTPIGINIPFNTRNGPFFSTLFFVSGYILSGFRPNQRWLFYGTLTLGIGCALHFSEIYLNWINYGTNLTQDYVFGTSLMGIGAAIASLSDHPILQRQNISKIGQMTLGIYVIHYIYIDIFRVLDKKISSTFWEAGYIIIVFCLSVLSIKLISNSRGLKKIAAY